MGKDLATLMTALHQWGDRWIYGEGHEPLLVLDRRSGRRIPRLRILNNEGRPLAGHDSRGDTQWRQGRAMNVDALWTSARAIKG